MIIISNNLIRLGCIGQAAPEVRISGVYLKAGRISHEVYMGIHRGSVSVHKTATRVSLGKYGRLLWKK